MWEKMQKKVHWAKQVKSENEMSWTKWHNIFTIIFIQSNFNYLVIQVLSITSKYIPSIGRSSTICESTIHWWVMYFQHNILWKISLSYVIKSLVNFSPSVFTSVNALYSHQVPSRLFHIYPIKTDMGCLLVINITCRAGISIPCGLKMNDLWIN